MTNSYLPAPVGYVARFERPTDETPKGVEYTHLSIAGFSADGGEPLTVKPRDFSDDWVFDAAFYDPEHVPGEPPHDEAFIKEAA